MTHLRPCSIAAAGPSPRAYLLIRDGLGAIGALEAEVLSVFVAKAPCGSPLWPPRWEAPSSAHSSWLKSSKVLGAGTKPLAGRGQGWVHE